MNRVSARAFVATVVLLATLAGCTSRPPDVGPVADRPDDGREWRCESLGALGMEYAEEVTRSWTVDGGSMLSIHRTQTDGTPSHGMDTRTAAETDALASAARASLDLLEQRGVSYDPVKREAIAGEVVDAALRGADVAFPRIRVVERGWDECVSTGTDSPADTTWLASVLVEYPIGLLRGDVNNVLWERERAANEAEVLAESAEEHLLAGRWHAGLLDAARAVAIVRGTGVQLEGVMDAPTMGSRAASAPVDARLVEILGRSTAAARAATPLTAAAEDRIVVIEAGAALDEAVRFHCTYEWGGRTLSAIGVPVRFEMPGASAILDADPVTDESGTATCRVLAANGSPGEYELVVSLDTMAAQAAVAAVAGPVDQDAGSSWMVTEQPTAQLVGHAVHLVSGTHAVSVCASFGERSDADAAQAIAGFARRMERDGFRMEECGPGVNVVVTGRLTIERHGAESDRVVGATLSASAFDQRTASDLGEVTITATQAVDSEGSDEGTREAEVLALKEVGRLLAVYFGPRILASRR